MELNNDYSYIGIRMLENNQIDLDLHFNKDKEEFDNADALFLTLVYLIGASGEDKYAKKFDKLMCETYKYILTEKIKDIKN